MADSRQETEAGVVLLTLGFSCVKGTNLSWK